MKRLLFSLLLGLGLAWAQFPITESFMNNTAPGWVLGGNASLTSGNGDPAGQGWLRLTRSTTYQRGYAYYNTAFPSTLGVRIEFDFLAWGGDGADGLSVFLFDGATTTFQIGEDGGGLGYCQGPRVGLSNAYVGIGFDEWGNFSNPNDRCRNGGPGYRRDSVAIRGPGNGSTGYAYLTGTRERLGGTPLAGTSIDYETSTSNRPSPSAYYRRARVDLVPVGSTYQITVYLATSQSGPFTRILGPYTMPSPPPPTLKIGFAGSTGAVTNYHEIRNLSITAPTAPADLKVTKTGPATATSGGSITYTVTVQNVGPSPLSGASFSDTVPAGITGVSWTCTGTGGASCASASGSGNAISTTLNLPLNSSVTFTITGTVSPSAAGQTLTNTASAFPPAGYGDTNPADNTASVSTQVVAGYALSGRVYHDLQPNGLREPGEDWSSGTSVRVNLVQGGSVVQSAEVSAGTGSFSFSGVVPGSYTLVLTNSASSTTPAPPSGWLFIEPSGGSRSLSVGSSDVSGQDFGLYHGSRISGTVFRDDGLGSGTANDALQNGGELGIAGVAVTAFDGSQSRSTLTDSLGNYVLYVPHGFGPSLTLSHPLAPATGSNVGGGSVALATAYGQSAAQQRTLSFASGNLYDGYNFGVVRPSLWQPDQSGQATSPGVVTYAHRVRPGTLGTLTFSRVGGNWNYLLRLDANCDGDFDDAGEGYQGLPYSLSVSGAWPREADGSLRACALEVMVIVPAGLPAGSSDFLNLEARLRYANNPNNVDEGLTLTDTTVVGTGGELRLTKQVQNLTQSTPPSTGRAEGRPGEELEYCIAYQNQGASPITQVVLTDPIPFFTDYQAGSLRLGATPLSDAADGDAGEVVGGLVRVRIGTLAAGAGGQVCYRVKIR